MEFHTLSGLFADISIPRKNIEKNYINNNQKLF
jgi:hypothetical protein